MIKKKQRVVVIGGNGFLGSFLIERLKKDGYKKIVVLDLSSNKVPEGVTFKKYNLGKNTNGLEKIVKKDDTVIHLACSVIPLTSEKNRLRDAEENIIGSLNLLEICAKKKIGRFIFISSGGAVYGDNSGKPFIESDELNPKSSYGVIKVAIEKYVTSLSNIYNINYTILRLSNLYGRKFLDSRQFGVVDIFISKCLNNEVIQIWGDGENVRDYIHIDDAVDFLMQTIKNDSISGIYNIGTGIGTNLNQVAKIVEKNTGKKLAILYLKSRNTDVKYNILSIKKAKKTGWKPKYNISSGIKKILLNKDSKLYI